MLDNVTEEMLSAYIDGELTDEARQEVERALSESASYRQMLDDLRGIQASFRQLPQYSLPANFHERVLQTAQERVPSRPAESAPPPVGTVVQRGPWSGVLVAMGILAATLTLAFLLDRPAPDGVLEDRWAQRDSSKSSGVGADRIAAAEQSLVYYVPRPELRPRYSLVVDVSVTPAGRSKGAVEDVFGQAGIPFDPDLSIDDELEELILASRLLSNVEVNQGNGAVRPRDAVQMAYVVGESGTIDDIWFKMRERPHDFAWVQLDLIINPRELNVLEQLNDSSRRRFASTVPKTKRTLAHRLVLSVSLQSSARLLGKFPSPALEARLVPTDESEGGTAFPKFELPVDRRPSDSPPAPAITARPAEESKAELSEVLFILRYPGMP